MNKRFDGLNYMATSNTGYACKLAQTDSVCFPVPAICLSKNNV